MSYCDACNLELGDGFVVENGHKLCARCLSMGVSEPTGSGPVATQMLVLDDEDVA